uniref:Amino acid transporter transmembrane domain-containing protein n=1 Tax=Octopus bimaculoides TaxID=37653 RepID=A0A0L8FVJ1_OCTBM
MSEKSHILHNSEKVRNSGFNEQSNFYRSVDKDLNACNNSSISTTNDDSSSSNSVSINTREAKNDAESTNVTAGFLLLNATVGIGIINLPEAYQNVDNLAIAISIHCILGGLSLISMLIVAYTTDKTQRSSLQDIVFDFYGEKYRTLSSVVIFVSLYFYCTSLIVLIGDQIEECK